MPTTELVNIYVGNAITFQRVKGQDERWTVDSNVNAHLSQYTDILFGN